MEMASNFLLMVINMMAIILMESLMVMGNINGKLDKYIKANGIMVLNKVKEFGMEKINHIVENGN